MRLAIDAPPDVIVAREELGTWHGITKPRNVIEAVATNAKYGGGESQFTEDDCRPAEPTDAPAGSEEKIAELARRVENGQSLWSDEDRDRRLATPSDVHQWVINDLEQEMRRVHRDDVEAAD